MVHHIAEYYDAIHLQVPWITMSSSNTQGPCYIYDLFDRNIHQIIQDNDRIEGYTLMTDTTPDSSQGLNAKPRPLADQFDQRQKQLALVKPQTLTDQTEAIPTHLFPGHPLPHPALLRLKILHMSACWP